MKYAKKLAEKAVSDITDGVIVASPYEKSCDYCEYGAICGYDEEAGYKERKVSYVNSKTIVEAAYGEDSATMSETDGTKPETAGTKPETDKGTIKTDKGDENDG